tara:strand:+ start:693 stop:941 length:249 start_codon:yes stop_codon:yes gene_type:complete
MSNTLNITLPIVNAIDVKDIIDKNYFHDKSNKRSISIKEQKKIQEKKINLANLLMKNIVNKKTRSKFSTNLNIIDVLNLFTS